MVGGIKNYSPGASSCAAALCHPERRVVCFAKDLNRNIVETLSVACFGAVPQNDKFVRTSFPACTTLKRWTFTPCQFKMRKYLTVTKAHRSSIATRAFRLIRAAGQNNSSKPTVLTKKAEGEEQEP
jgi:hypothetical protein